MKFIKKYWPWILLCGALLYFSIQGAVTTSNYKEAIQEKNDSIDVLDSRVQILVIELENSQDLFIQSEDEILLYQDSLDKERTTITRNREIYEDAIIDLISIPSDTMYREVTRWLDSR